MDHREQQRPDDVREIAARLTAARETLSPHELDDLRRRVGRRVGRGPRRGRLARWRTKWVAAVLATGLMLTTGAGVVIACSSIGGGSNTYDPISFHNMRDASFCQYRGPFTRTYTIKTRHGILVVVIVWDCRHLTIHFVYGDPFSWRWNGGGPWSSSFDATAPNDVSGLTVSTDGTSYSFPFSW